MDLRGYRTWDQQMYGPPQLTQQQQQFAQYQRQAYQRQQQMHAQATHAATMHGLGLPCQFGGKTKSERNLAQPFKSRESRFSDDLNIPGYR